MQSVKINAAVAKALERAPKEFTTVKDAHDADIALGSADNEHCCPLCGLISGTYEFVRHAPSCIETNAPKWELQRDKEPPYAKIKRYNTRTVSIGQGDGSY